MQTLQGVFERAVYSLDWAVSPFDAAEGDLGCIAATGGDGKIAVWAVVSDIVYWRGSKLSFYMQSKSIEDSTDISTSLLASIEDAHEISDINCIKWCTTKAQAPKRRPSSDQDEPEDDGMDQNRADDVYTQRSTEALKGLLATAGDDGLIKIWSLVECNQT